MCCENLSHSWGRWGASDIASTVSERIKGLTAILLCVFLYVILDKCPLYFHILMVSA